MLDRDKKFQRIVLLVYFAIIIFTVVGGYYMVKDMLKINEQLKIEQRGKGMAFYCYGEKNTVNRALIGGTVVIYDACSKSKDAYNKDVFAYIGEGTIHSVDGIKQTFTEKEHFFVKRNR